LGWVVRAVRGGVLKKGQKKAPKAMPEPSAWGARLI
jgi:hypothetical protein